MGNLMRPRLGACARIRRRHVLQTDEPDDFAATGRGHCASSRWPFEHAGFDWQQYVKDQRAICGSPRWIRRSATRPRPPELSWAGGLAH